MRVMVFVPGDANSEAGTMPSPELVGKMMKFNEELVKAGVMLAGDGLMPTSTAKRVRFSGSQRTVLDGPFAETKEVLGGYWMIDVASRAEAIEWARKCPASPNEVIEIRQVMEMTDFPADVQQAAAVFEEMHEASRRG